MARRIEAGPIVVVLGAVLLLVSLFLEWFARGADAWTVFEIVDLLLAAPAIGAALAALGLLMPELALLERRWVAPLAFAALVLVVSQLIDPPPAVVEGELGAGAALALAAALLLLAGALLSFSRVRFALTVEGRDPRQRQPAVVREGGARVAPAPTTQDDPGLTTVRMPPPTGAEPVAAPPPRDG